MILLEKFRLGFVRVKIDDNPVEKTNGEFDIVTWSQKGYVFYEAIEEGADLDDKDKHGNNSLVFASTFYNSPNLIKYLISNGLSVKRVDKINGMTFAHYTAYNSNPEIMK